MWRFRFPAWPDVRISRFGVAAIQLGLLWASVWRGLDYLLFPDQETRSLSLIEQAMPLIGWGLCFTVLGVVGLVAWQFRSLAVVSVVHGFLVGAYAAFAVGFMWDITHVPGGFDGGWRTATGWVCVQCVAHTVIAQASLEAWRSRRA